MFRFFAFIFFTSIGLVIALIDSSNLVNAAEIIKGVATGGEGAMEQTYKQIGDRFAWGTLLFSISALFFFPIRRWLFPYLRNTIGEEKAFRIYVNVRNFHVPIGIIAITAAFSHGFLEFNSKPSIGFNEYFGVLAISFLWIAAIQGTMMVYKSKKRLRAGHLSCTAVAFIFLVIHVIM